jgi:glycosyltransferase involved in cell wall biosynthesis
MESNKKRRKILVFIDWYEPGFRAGGPIRSVANMARRLPYDFSIVTQNHDHHDETPYANLPVGKWVRPHENVRVIYLDKERRRSTTYQKIAKTEYFDRIYLNSMFSYFFSILPLRIFKKPRQRERIVLAPRGMLKKGALSLKSPKKKFFLFFAKLSGLYKGITWHATSEQEKKEIQAIFGNKVRIKVAPNLVNVPENFPAKNPKESGHLRLVSIARVSPEKNIHEALRYLNDTSKKGKIEYHIYGSKQDEKYLAECEKIAKGLEHVDVKFFGALEYDKVASTIAQYDFFYLPTLGENYGHAIVESMLTGTPVIISDKTPWRHLEKKRAGWDLKNDRILFNQVLNHCLMMNNQEYELFSRGALNFGSGIANNEEDMRKNMNLFI